VASARAAGGGTPVPAPFGALDGVAPSANGPDAAGGLVFFIGLVGYDFGTEARRDTFKQQMPPALYNYTTSQLQPTLQQDGTPLSDATITELRAQGFQIVPSNPYDSRQMVLYLRRRPDEARSLIWTLNLELTPVYAIEPVNGFADRVYNELVNMLEGQSQAEGSKAYVERVSVPAVLSGQSVRLFSGQMVSEILVDATRGMYAWQTSDLIARAVDYLKSVRAQLGPSAPQRPTEDEVRTYLRQVLNKLYYQYRNLGITSPDRALNFAATNIFQLVEALVGALVSGKTLERIDVGKSPYGRIDSDCWDVELKFLDPENTNRAYSVFRFTLDVSDKLPVTLGRLVDYISI
jgi:cyanobactin maturation PatA/PatG family protease